MYSPIHTLNPQADRIHTPDPYQNAGDLDRSIRLPRADPYPSFDATPIIYV